MGGFSELGSPRCSSVGRGEKGGEGWSLEQGGQSGSCADALVPGRPQLADLKAMGVHQWVGGTLQGLGMEPVGDVACAGFKGDI